MSRSPGPDRVRAALGIRLRRLWQKAGQTARLAIGIGDYDTYAAHRRAQHPGEPVMSRAEFFRAQQDARYGKGSSRCC